MRDQIPFCPLVVVARLEKVDSFAPDLLHQAMFLRDPSRPSAHKPILKRFRLAHSLEGIFQYRIDQFKDAERHFTVGLYPPPQVLEELRLEDGFPLNPSAQARAHG